MDEIKSYINLQTIYHNSCMFRPFVQPKFSDIIYNMLQYIIKNKNIFLVCNYNTTSESPVIKKFFTNVKNLKIHHIDNVNTFECYEHTKNEITNVIHDIDIILVCGGSLRLLALEFDTVQLIDIGSYFRIF